MNLASVGVAKQRAVLFVWLACIASVLSLEDGEFFNTWIPESKEG